MEDLLCCPTLRRVFQTEHNPFVYESGSLPGRRRRNHSLPFKLKGRFLTRFHYYMYIVLPGYGYNGIFCGHCQIAVGVHWMEFVSHVKFRQLQTQR